jgi:hypothetical protein
MFKAQRLLNSLLNNLLAGSSAIAFSSLLVLFGTSARAQPTNVSVTPSSGTGMQQTFTFKASSPYGASNVSMILFSVESSLSGYNACRGMYIPETSSIYLLDNSYSQWLPPRVLGSATTQENSQCKVHLATSSVSLSGSTVTLNVTLEFKAAFAGPQNIYMFSADYQDLFAYWQQMGTWTVGAGGPPPPPPPPSGVSVTPSSGSGSTQIFTASYASTANLQYTQIWWAANSGSAANSCMILLVHATGQFQVLNNAASAWRPPGQNSNSQCTLNTGQSGYSNNGSTATMTVSLSFAPAFSGAKGIWLWAQNTSGQSAGWSSQLGSWTVPSAPNPVTVTLNSSPGGMTLTTDGVACTAPCSRQWTPGSQHTIGAPSTSSFAFSAWSDGQAQTHVVTVPGSAVSYTATFVAAPQVSGMSPSISGSEPGLSQVFSMHLSGANLASGQVVFNSNTQTPNTDGCYIAFYMPSGSFQLIGTGITIPGPQGTLNGTLGSGPIVANSYCSLDPSQSNLVATAGGYDVNLKISFASSFPYEIHPVWSYAANAAGTSSSWVPIGAWIQDNPSLADGTPLSVVEGSGQPLGGYCGGVVGAGFDFSRVNGVFQADLLARIFAAGASATWTNAVSNARLYRQDTLQGVNYGTATSSNFAIARLRATAPEAAGSYFARGDASFTNYNCVIIIDVGFPGYVSGDGHTVTLSDVQEVYQVQGDPTPVVTGWNQVQSLYPGGTAYVEIYGRNFGPYYSAGGLNVCSAPSGSCTSPGTLSVAGISYWSPGQINVQLQASAGAQPGTYWLQVTAGSNAYGQSFQPGGGTGSVAQVRAAATVTPLVFSCTGTVERGSAVTCTITGASASSVSGWKFTGGGAVVNGPNGTTSWSGTIVASGTVTVNVAGYFGPLAQTITVTPRNWHTQPANPVQVPNGQLVVAGVTITLPVPPVPGPNSSSNTGVSGFRLAYAGFNSTSIQSGPNAGFSYYATPLAFQESFYRYIINPDLENPTSIFSVNQCGTNGFIYWSDLLAQTRRHEYNSPVQSHWAFYSNAINNFNLGDYFEARVASAGTNLAGFKTTTGQQLDQQTAQVESALGNEPYGVNSSETGLFLGNINYGPTYGNCN